MLLREFASFWIEQGDSLTESITYREAGAQLVLMAFLQRIVNGGGTVTREYGIGSRRIDLLLTWPYTDASGKRQVQREALELKVWRDGRKDPLSEGLVQIDRYLDKVGLDSGVLVLFDRRSNAPARMSSPYFTRAAITERCRPAASPSRRYEKNRFGSANVSPPTSSIEGSASIRAQVAAHIAYAEKDPTGRLLASRLSRLSRLECHVKPLRAGDAAMLATYDAFFTRARLSILDVSGAIHLASARVRSQEDDGRLRAGPSFGH